MHYAVFWQGLALINKINYQPQASRRGSIAFSSPVTLGVDPDGDPSTSCTIEPQDAADLKRSKARLLKGSNQVAHQALHDALKNKGNKMTNSEHYPSGRRVVNAKAWYDEFKLRRANDDVKEDSLRTAFKRARNWLQDQDFTREYDDKVWFIDEADRKDI